HSAGPQNNAWGFVPGRPRDSCCWRRPPRRGATGWPPPWRGWRPAAPRGRSCFKPTRGGPAGGRRARFPRGAARRPAATADHPYRDMNGEPYRADEFGFATCRVGGLFRDPSAFTTPADCWGDVGAAPRPLFLVLSDAATRKGYATGAVRAGFTSSESGERC